MCVRVCVCMCQRVWQEHTSIMITNTCTMYVLYLMEASAPKTFTVSVMYVVDECYMLALWGSLRISREGASAPSG